MSHDAVLVFAKSWGALYILLFFIIAVAWAYWPSRREELEEASRWPLEEEDRPCQ
jgi:cytochrome c oxidase cbb3-type subunit IV